MILYGKMLGHKISLEIDKYFGVKLAFYSPVQCCMAKPRFSHSIAIFSVKNTITEYHVISHPSLWLYLFYFISEFRNPPNNINLEQMGRDLRMRTCLNMELVPEEFTFAFTQGTNSKSKSSIKPFGKYTP